MAGVPHTMMVRLYGVYHQHQTSSSASLLAREPGQRTNAQKATAPDRVESVCIGQFQELGAACRDVMTVVVWSLVTASWRGPGRSSTANKAQRSSDNNLMQLLAETLFGHLPLGKRWMEGPAPPLGLLGCCGLYCGCGLGTGCGFKNPWRPLAMLPIQPYGNLCSKIP